jgi:mono/diheme cytochrome c family protein
MRWKGRLLALIGFLAIAGAIVGAGYFLLGFYNVGASQAEPDAVAWALARTRAASIDRHATERPPGSLDDPAMVHAGARAYAERGCVNCHGAPGVAWGKWSEGLRPDPPDLKKIVKDREPRQLFWVVKNGIGMTGMPAFGYLDDKEIWTIVAFVRKIAEVSPEDFKTWSAPAPAAAPGETR